MLSSPSNNINTNLLLEEKAGLLEIASSATPSSALRDLNYSWDNNTIAVGSPIAETLFKHGLTVEENGKTRFTYAGLLFYGRLVLPFNFTDTERNFQDTKYILLERIKIGKNSAIFSAKHALLNTPLIVKFIRPGASQNTLNSLKLLNDIPEKTPIVRPLDFLKTYVHDVFENKVVVDCVVYPLVLGITLKAFLAQKSYQLNSRIAIAFIEQVGSALFDLERAGAYHGDLHDENIIVEIGVDGVVSFKLIDISFGAMGSLTTEECRNEDLSRFKQHVWRILSLQKSFLPRMSLRKFLKTKYFEKINKILAPDTANFRTVISIFTDDTEYITYSKNKDHFLRDKFNPPTTFRLQRYEEIIDPSVAARLFVPFAELMNKVIGFSNVYVSGNRGSGKSTYLAAMAFFPQADSATNDCVVRFQEIFGIYFPCRQGEFKSLVPSLGWTKEEIQLKTVKILLVKIIRRTLEAISAGIKANKLISPLDFKKLHVYLERFAPPPGIISISNSILDEMENYVSTMIRIEMQLLSVFKTGHSAENSNIQFVDLIEFFTILRLVFTELSVSRFHILFDDAGLPNIPIGVQRVICDLILNSNPVFCVKFSAEKFTFTFETSLGKVPENGHDYFEHDISRMLFIGSATERMPRQGLEIYFRKIVEQRLAYFKYQESSIVAYIGDNPNIADQLIGLLAAKRSDALYAGWTAVWNIADRTPRNLLEIVSEIFARGEITNQTTPHVVSLKIQDKAIRTISDKRLQSLSQVAGVITVKNENYSLGRRLFEVTAIIGSVFSRYLRDEKGRERKRQHLAIERNDLDALNMEANEVLQKLITYGVLDDTKSEVARDDGVKKPIYVLNRIYCPAFNIMYRRDEHLRLSKAKFEMLLLHPQEFGRRGTKRLANATLKEQPEADLFGYKLYD